MRNSPRAKNQYRKQRVMVNLRVNRAAVKIVCHPVQAKLSQVIVLIEKYPKPILLKAECFKIPGIKKICQKLILHSEKEMTKKSFLEILSLKTRYLRLYPHKIAVLKIHLS